MLQWNSLSISLRQSMLYSFHSKMLHVCRSGQALCVHQCYTPSSQRCLSGTVCPSGQLLCNYRCYRPTTQRCFSGRIVSASNQLLCGSRCYNPHLQRCLGGGSWWRNYLCIQSTFTEMSRWRKSLCLWPDLVWWSRRCTLHLHSYRDGSLTSICIVVSATIP